MTVCAGRLSRLLVLALAVAVVAPAQAGAGASTPERLAAANRPARGPASADEGPARGLIVRYRPGTAATAREAVRRSEALEHVGSLRGVDLELVRPRGRSLEAALRTLLARPEVEAAALDRRRSLAVDPRSEPRFGSQWGHHNTGQTVGGSPGVADVDVDGLEALAVTGGTPSVVVAVIDDGVDFSHPDLAGTAWTNPGEVPANGLDDDDNGYVDDVNGWDFCNDDATVHDPDEDWHGTAVAGTIAGRLNGDGIAGMAPGTRIMALKFLMNPDADGSVAGRCGYDSQAIEAISYARSFGVRIINASWGGPGGNPLLESAIETSGALFVTAAGNEGLNIDRSPSYPAAFDSPNIVSVGAVGNRGSMPAWSNYGAAAVDLAAPGESIVAPCPADSTYSAPGWCTVDGTSFAAPYTAGVAALVGALRPSALASPASLRVRIVGSAVPVASLKNLVSGGRLLNARRALDFTPPTIGSGLRVSPLSPAALATSTVAARVSWPAATDDFGMGAYRVEERRNGGAWETLSRATTALYLDRTLMIGTTYEYRVQPRDLAGNSGAFSPVFRFVPARVEESGPGVTYAGAWRTASSSAASGGATRYTVQPGASVSWTFSGRAIAIVAPVGPTRASFKLYVNGAYARTISLHASTAKDRQVVASYGWGTWATRTVKLVQAPVSGRTRADLDAFVVFR